MTLSRMCRYAGVLAAAAVALQPGLAHASTCISNIVGLPSNGDTGVPTDALLWGWGYSSARLLGPEGEVVPTSVRGLPVAQLGGVTWDHPVLVPSQALAPNTRYTIESDEGGDITFTTGSGPVSVPVPLPVLISAEPEAGAGFGGAWRSAGLEFQHQGILIGDVGGTPSFTSAEDLFVDEQSLASEAAVSHGLQWITARSSPPAGSGDCLIWPEGASDDASARFGVLDLAGNFSGWVDVDVQLPMKAEAEAAALADLQAPPPEGPFSSPSACSFTARGTRGGAAWLTLAVAGSVALGRRFRRRAHR